MSDEAIIRAATVGDAEAIARIHVAAWRAAYAGFIPADFLAALSEERRAATWRRQLQAAREPVFVDEAAGVIRGWIVAGVGRDEDTADACEIHAIYIAPSHWRQGIGRRLMQRMESALPPSSDLSLWTFRDHAPALRFYASLDYRMDGTEKAVERGGATQVQVRLMKLRPNYL